jgi:hypothetical protein
LKTNHLATLIQSNCQTDVFTTSWGRLPIPFFLYNSRLRIKGCPRQVMNMFTAKLQSRLRSKDRRSFKVFVRKVFGQVFIRKFWTHFHHKITYCFLYIINVSQCNQRKNYSILMFILVLWTIIHSIYFIKATALYPVGIRSHDQ